MKIPEINLEVRYFKELNISRIKQGWSKNEVNKDFESQVFDIKSALTSLTDFDERIHIVSGNGYEFSRDLISYLVKNNLKWINWTERSGVNLFKILRENSKLFKLVFPIYQRLYNRKFATLVQRHAMFNLSSGVKAEEDYLKKGVSKKKIRHLYYALPKLERVDTPPRLLSNFVEKHEHCFIYVGSLCKRKGIDVLIKSFSKIESRKWGLILVGHNTLPQYYDSLIKKLGLNDNVILTGAIESSVVNQYLSSADVFILPTRFDGWGAVLNEATSIGLPVISTDECGAAFHLLEDGYNGYRVSAGSIDQLKHAMCQYVETPDLVQLHGANSLKIYQNFTPKENAVRLLKILSENDV
ncbi:glycosyltransferase [Vibrio cyclitrophicus]|nr:glycosyltransferase [Vibrio cyclitrophicus]